MPKRKKVWIVSREDALKAAQELSGLMSKVAGSDSERPLFKGFRISARVTQGQQAGAQAYTEGKFDEAKSSFEEAFGSLNYLLRQYFRGSLEKYFTPQLQKLEETGLNQDLYASVRKVLKALEAKIRVADTVLLDEAAKAYWQAEDRLVLVHTEMSQRLEKRAAEQLAAEAERKRQEREAELARQCAALEEQRRERGGEMAALFGQLAESTA